VNEGILVGHGSSEYFDSGYFYCPYTPLAATPVFAERLESPHLHQRIFVGGKRLAEPRRWNWKRDGF
jgi:hypothetical protein